jgi:hypothetical protein
VLHKLFILAAEDVAPIAIPMQAETGNVVCGLGFETEGALKDSPKTVYTIPDTQPSSRTSSKQPHPSDADGNILSSSVASEAKEEGADSESGETVWSECALLNGSIVDRLLWACFQSGFGK